MATARNTTKTAQPADGLSADERAAVKERAKELRASAKAASKAEAVAADAQAMAEKIAELDDAERAIAERLHELVMAAAPQLRPKTYYGMPGWAKGDKVLLYFKPASKFKMRYANLGFLDSAALDDGDFWPTEYALVELTKSVEERIAKLVTQAASD